jgi:hypothetical protein
MAWPESSLSGVRIQHVACSFRIDATDDSAAGRATFLTTFHLEGLGQPLTGVTSISAPSAWKVRRLRVENRWMYRRAIDRRLADRDAVVDGIDGPRHRPGLVGGEEGEESRHLFGFG